MDEYSEELMKIILQQIYDGVDSYCDVSELIGIIILRQKVC